eukprot:4372087-Pyramimonas_sp.AAC.1
MAARSRTPMRRLPEPKGHTAVLSPVGGMSELELFEKPRHEEPKEEVPKLCVPPPRQQPQPQPQQQGEVPMAMVTV